MNDHIGSANRTVWENLAREKCGFTQPWLNLDLNTLEKYVRGELETFPESFACMFPSSVLEGVAGKDVLCLASGGGQQSAVFALLGARVTVVDIAEGQLAGDRLAAKHYGYNVTTIQADMRDLSMLPLKSFDLIFQAPSMAYIPDTSVVYGEVARVLRSGAIYRVEFTNPVSEFIDHNEWDGSAYRLTTPYAEKSKIRSDGGIEFRHHLKDIFNGLIAEGFTIERVEESPDYMVKKENVEPGSWAHLVTYTPDFAVIAKLR